MQLAMIGLGRMGSNMAQRLLNDHHDLLVYDPSPAATTSWQDKNVTILSSLTECKRALKQPRIAWIMVPHGAPTDAVIDELSHIFEEGDIIIDGGNSHFLTSIERNQALATRGIHFIDVGVSGGVFGLERGYCLMIGGDVSIVKYLSAIFTSLSPGIKVAPATRNRTQSISNADNGFYHCGPSGAGHYVKMIHNAIEYGMMQAYAEGLELLANANAKSLPEKQRFTFDLPEICELWRRGSVINSWLLDLLSEALHKSPSLAEFSGIVPDSGEGRWALIEAIKQGTPSSILSTALFTRFRSRQIEPMSLKSLSALRKEFGGHQEVTAERN